MVRASRVGYHYHTVSESISLRIYEANFNLPLTDQEREHATGLIRMVKSGLPAKGWPETKDAWFSQEFIDRVKSMMRDPIEVSIARRPLVDLS